jgi:hypothetical protein
MTADCDRIFVGSGGGRCCPGSLSIFAGHLGDEIGKIICLGDPVVNRSFFIIFFSGAGPAGTFAKRMI